MQLDRIYEAQEGSGSTTCMQHYFQSMLSNGERKRKHQHSHHLTIVVQVYSQLSKMSPMTNEAIVREDGVHAYCTRHKPCWVRELVTC